MQQQTLRILAGGLSDTPPSRGASAHDRLRLGNAAVANSCHRHVICLRRLGWYHEDLLVHRRIAERHRAADPKAFALGGSDLVAHPLPDQFPFELSK